MRWGGRHDVLDRGPREHDEVDRQILESVAAQRRILQSAIASRQQMARDLHDGAQQRLVNLLIRLQLAGEELPPDDTVVRALLDGAVAEARAAISDLRELASGMHPSILTTRGLLAAAQALAARAVTPTTVTAILPHAIPSDIEAGAYFLIAEALANVAKHAHAEHAAVILDGDQHRLDLTISDDGIGGANARRGSGLIGMADRAAALGGSAWVDSPHRGGTEVRAMFPLCGTPAKPCRSAACTRNTPRGKP